jgi:hypothetical protein
MASALIIGCGNIGGLYDLNNDLVQSHSKAMYNATWIKKVDIHDINLDLAKKISKKYGFGIINSLPKNLHYNLVCISTPTRTHFNYLKLAIESKTPLVICEKPISNNVVELKSLLMLYSSGESKIMVNYFRRFQNKYKKLKHEYNFIFNEINTIEVNYYKGILNNASHALDLVIFLTNKNLYPESVEILKSEYDSFDFDPTVSLKFNSNNVNFIMNGANIKSPIFEINFISKNHTLKLIEGGNTALIFENNILIKKIDNLTLNYMTDVYLDLEKLFLKIKNKDNFIQSLNLNKQQITNFIK